MIVTCPRCLTKFNLPGEKAVSGAELQLHCSRCGCDFLFSPLDEDGLETMDSDLESPPVEDEFATINDEVSEFVELELDKEELPSDSSSLDVENAAPEVVEDSASDLIFELSDDDQDPDMSFDEGLDFQEDDLEPEAPESSQVENSDQAIEDLALDLDDLNLDDIEFDSFGDKPGPAEEFADEPEKSASERKTTLDDGEFDDLLEQVEEPPAKSEVLKVAGDRGQEPAQQVQKSPPIKPSEAPNTKRNFILVFCCFLVLSLALWAGFGLWKRFSVDMKKHLKLVEVENQRLSLASDRLVVVIRGKVVNSSPKLVSDLKIKGVLLDAAGKIVAEVVTAGGVSFSEEELDRLDAGKLALLENAAVTLAPDGGELPFMIAFYDYPEKAAECYVELSSFKVKKGRRP